MEEGIGEGAGLHGAICTVQRVAQGMSGPCVGELGKVEKGERERVHGSISSASALRSKFRATDPSYMVD